MSESREAGQMQHMVSPLSRPEFLSVSTYCFTWEANVLRGLLHKIGAIWDLSAVLPKS